MTRETPEINDFIAISTMRNRQLPDWSRARHLEIDTEVFLADDDAEPKEKVGLMKLWKIPGVWDDDVIDVLDELSSDNLEVGEAIAKVCDMYSPLWDEEVFNNQASGNYLVEWFEVLQEFRGKRLGHAIFHAALQASGAEGHPVFLFPSLDDERHAGRDYLRKFYEDADEKSYLVEGTNIHCFSSYNGEGSVMKKRKDLGK